MTEFTALEELVPARDEEPDWEDVLRRARPARRIRLVVAVLVAVAVFGVAPALAVVLFRDHGLGFPPAADKSNIVVILAPQTGRILLEVAPRKDGNGFCFRIKPLRAGCVPRSKETVLMRPPLFGWSFDPRIVSGTATAPSGKTFPLFVRHFGGRIDATIYMARGRLVPRLLKSVVLRDASGNVVSRFAFKH